eukprot:7035931-Karenia_brevis.AAC.1
MTNAFGSVKRSAVQDAVQRRLPHLRNLVDRLMCQQTVNILDLDSGKTARFAQGTGVAQGCPLSMLLFCAVMADVIDATQERLLQEGKTAKVLAYADDLYVVGDSTHLPRALDILVETLSGKGLSCNAGKTRVWCSSQEGFEALPAPLRSYVVPELPVLGSTLYHHDREDPLAVGLGSPEAKMSAAAHAVRQTSHALKVARGKGLSIQVAGAILRYVTVGAPQHMLRSRLWARESLEMYDAEVQRAWEELLDVKLTPEQARVGNLPLQAGGCAFGFASGRALPAFLAGWRIELSARADMAGAHSAQTLLGAVP